MPRAERSRHAATRINAYSFQCEKWSEGDLPMRSVTWAEGLKMVQDGKATWEYGRAGIKGIRFCEKQRAQNPSPCTLTMSVMKSVSGEGLSGPHSIDNGALDGVEEGMRIKFHVWALVGDTRAVCVRPRISDDDRRRAEKLLGLKAA
jgi:hypothetical protein